MEIVAYIKYLRISPKKLKSTAKTVVGLQVKDALDQLSMINNKAATLLIKAIKSAKANAENNFKIKESDLKIKRIEVNKGIIFKRFRPVARGMAHQIKKRTSHLKVVIERIEKEEKKEKLEIEKKKIKSEK